MSQRIEQPNDEDSDRIEAQRVWVRDHYEPASRSQYDTLEGKLRLLDTILREKWIGPTETVKLQCLGITLGDAFVQELGMSWVSVEDEYGRDPAVQLPGTSIVLFPLTMISKRLEMGETVDVYAMFASVCSKVRELAERGA
jgi:hypothetical protein